LITELEERMQQAADNLEFELAADIRDRIRELRAEHDLDGAGNESDGVPEPVPDPGSERRF
jgi:excinuclease ABC subunit B